MNVEAYITIFSSQQYMYRQRLDEWMDIQYGSLRSLLKKTTGCHISQK
jgi:hypothetical protein